MGDLGAGVASSYPGALDTNPTPEVAGNQTAFEPGEGALNGVIAVQTELGTDPAGSLADVKTFLQAEHSVAGKHTFKIAHIFTQDDVADSQSAVALLVAGSTPTEIEMPWAGSIVGISILSNDSRTAGSCIVDATINGVATGLQAILNASNADHHSAVQAIAVDAFSAGDRIGVDITTDAGWLPVTADIVVVVYVSFN